MIERSECGEVDGIQRVGKRSSVLACYLHCYGSSSAFFVVCGAHPLCCLLERDILESTS
jgi:hypothetical protein